MGHLALFPGNGHPTPPVAKASTLTVLLDYQPVMDQVDLIELEMSAVWGTPEELHADLTRLWGMGKCFELMDRMGDIWPFHPETIRAFWVR